MPECQPKLVALIAVATFALTAYTALARVDVKVEFDKNFDFTPVRTWGWNPAGPGEVKMARAPKEDNPESMKRATEPLILETVAAEMPRRGLKEATSEPDLTLTYYLLLTTSMSTQTLGQFLPATTAWGLPPFEQTTQSLKMMNQGALVLDLSAKGTVVWRGVAQAKIEIGRDLKRREALLREAVRDLLKRYPPKP